jgi:hypothetical protein
MTVGWCEERSYNGVIYFFLLFFTCVNAVTLYDIYKMLNESDTTKLMEGHYTWIIVFIIILMT